MAARTPGAKAAKPAAKKPATRKKPAAKSKSTRRRTKPVERAATASGRRLPAAIQAVRDTRMIARLGQGWTWEMIAAEAGIDVSSAKRAVAARRAAAPLDLSMDPVKIIEQTFEGFQLSIGDYEALAADATEKGQLAVAVGAKKGANEAREKVMMLLQLTGRLPQELGALRHLIDLRAIAVKMLDTMDRFERAVLEFEMEAATRREVHGAVLEVRSTFHDLLGIDDAPPEAEAAEEQPALPESVG